MIKTLRLSAKIAMFCKMRASAFHDSHKKSFSSGFSPRIQKTASSELTLQPEVRTGAQRRILSSRRKARKLRKASHQLLRGFCISTSGFRESS
jgi:hypothetical protein